MTQYTLLGQHNKVLTRRQRGLTSSSLDKVHGGTERGALPSGYFHLNVPGQARHESPVEKQEEDTSALQASISRVTPATGISEPAVSPVASQTTDGSHPSVDHSWISVQD